MKKFNQLLILGTTLLLSAAALTGCSGSSAMGATIPQTTSGEPATPQTDAGIIASETTGSNNRLNEIRKSFKRHPGTRIHRDRDRAVLRSERIHRSHKERRGGLHRF